MTPACAASTNRWTVHRPVVKMAAEPVLDGVRALQGLVEGREAEERDDGAERLAACQSGVVIDVLEEGRGHEVAGRWVQSPAASNTAPSRRACSMASRTALY
jgi:hypothetical protein